MEQCAPDSTGLIAAMREEWKKIDLEFGQRTMLGLEPRVKNILKSNDY